MKFNVEFVQYVTYAVEAGSLDDAVNKAQVLFSEDTVNDKRVNEVDVEDAGSYLNYACWEDEAGKWRECFREDFWGSSK